MRALDRKLLRDLWRLKGQLAAICLVMASGVAIYVMARGTLHSLEQTRTAYYERQRFADVFAHLKRAPAGLAARIAEIPGVAQAETRIVVDVTLDLPDLAEPAMGRLLSVPEDGRPVLNIPHLRQGAYPDPAQRDQAVVGEAFAEAHGLGPGDRLSAVINGHRRVLTIVGIALSPEYVYSIAPGGLLPDDKRFGVLWMDRATLEAATDLDGAFNDVALRLTAAASKPAVIERLDDLLGPYGGVGAYGRADQPSDFFVAGELEELRATGIVSPAIFLGVAAFLLNIVISRLVATQREQIGTLKACGYGNRAIGLHYAELTLVIAAVGILVGTAVGAWFGLGITQLYTRFFRFPLLEYRLTPSVVATAALISAAAALAGALGAIRQAVRLSPAEAMRPAAPLAYRRTTVERLGLQRLLGHSGRMVLRHIERRPVRALLSGVGIAISVAILIAAWFTIDSIDHIMNLQFNLAQRENLTVTFVEPRSRRALDEVAHLPGVLAAEPFRAVPARLRAGSRTERVALTGVDPGGDLRRIVDAAGRPVAVPEHGVMLSDKLAQLLGVGLGDELRVEVLEGSRPVRQLRVTGLVEDYIGTSAYLALPELNRAMLEGRTISGAYLLIDSLASADLYQRLKALPGVAGIALKTAMLQTFRETMAGTLWYMIGFNVAFAGLIAFGVVYNGARIALSERARELASLRVLGFSRREVSAILLGELALLTGLALPLGCLIGYGFAWLISLALDRELYRIPLIIDRSTYAYAVLVVLVATVLSGLVVGRRLDRLDLVATLKTRE